MSLIDDLRKSAQSAARFGATLAGEGARRFAAFADEFLKADPGRRDAPGAAAGAEVPPGPKALHFDPLDVVAAMGYRDRPSPISYNVMRAIGRGVPIIADVINTRVEQVAVYCGIPERERAPGFGVRLRKGSGLQPSAQTEQRCEELAQILLHTGVYDPARPQDSVPLESFARMLIRDSLIYDQATFEIVRDRLGRPLYLSIVDPATIRLLDPAQRAPDDPFAVQVINGAIYTDFLPDELAFCVRNLDSNIRAYGYGESEVETLIKEITGLLWGMEYNRRFFSQGSATKGILHFKGAIPEQQLKAFRRQWHEMLSGVWNAWRTPITSGESDLQWINLQMSNRDMEYSAWMDFLIKIVCARFKIAPEEVNFAYGNTGQSQAMGTAPIEEKLKASRDLGLRPLVRWFFMQLNTHFLQQLDPNYEAYPIGLDDRGELEEAQLLGQQLATYMTLDEVRERAKLPPLGPEKGGGVILNPTYMAVLNMPAPDQPGPGGDEPGPGDDDEPGPDDDEEGWDEDDEDEPGDAQAPGPGAVGKSLAGRRARVRRYVLDI